MWPKKSKGAQTKIESLIGAGTQIHGDLAFSGGLRIDGEVRGNVRCSGDAPGVLIVSENARVEGEIHVAEVYVNGTVVGPIHASEFVELQSGARISGDVHYSSLEMQPGAVVQGRMLHAAGATAAKPVELKVASGN